MEKDDAVMRGPRKLADYPDRAIDCEESLERPFQAIRDGLQDSGLSEQAAGEALLTAASVIEADWIVAEQLRAIRALAVEAGWTEEEATGALQSLAENNMRGIAANALTEAGIAKAKGLLQ